MWRLVYLIYIITNNSLTLLYTCSFHMNDVTKCIQQGIINCDYLDMYCPCHIYEIRKSKELGDALKLSIGVAMQATRWEGVISMGNGGRGSLYVILLYWNFIISLAGYCKRFYKILFFPLYFCCFTCWNTFDRPKVQVTSISTS